MPSRNWALAGFSRCAGASSSGSCGESQGASTAEAAISARQMVAVAMIGVEVRKPSPGRNGVVTGIDGSAGFRWPSDTTPQSPSRIVTGTGAPESPANVTTALPPSGGQG